MSEVELLGAFQLAIQQSIKAMKLADMATGTVLSGAPLSVQLDVSVPPIPEQALLLTDAVNRKCDGASAGRRRRNSNNDNSGSVKSRR